MFCEKCGTEIQQGDKFCPSCGTEVTTKSTETVLPKKKKINFYVAIALVVVMIVLAIIFKDDFFTILFIAVFACVFAWINRKLPKKNKKGKPEIEQYTLKDAEIKKFETYFVSKNEQYISSLGNGYIMNYLTSGSLKKGFAIISNKRVYFKGSCFSGHGKFFLKTNEERTVDIKDITGSGFIYQRYLGILLGLFVALASLICGVCGILFGDISPFEYASSIANRNGDYRLHTAVYELSECCLEEDYSEVIDCCEKVYKIVCSSDFWEDEEDFWEDTIDYWEDTIEDATEADWKEAAAFYDEMAIEYERSAKEYEKEVQTKDVYDSIVFIGLTSLTALLLTFIVSCFSVFLQYLKKRKTMFQIQYAGGCIAFNVSYYAKAEIDDFQKQLRRAKDLYEEHSISPVPVKETPVQVQPQSTSASDDLRKYAELLKEGLISQEEYDALKKKTLGL